ncbi:hypothetical protein FALBO_5894 [Fusarium albosuccineum]|uniref:Uncharacterized protein n=1 Tax=Fusarium albosuccineum TaxID=1237068 RepID=A0A8H4PC95_9HYPO|nr:hypothetical protein FALBO_5894 [Fusarium albosuccineum]
MKTPVKTLHEELELLNSLSVFSFDELKLSIFQNLRSSLHFCMKYNFYTATTNFRQPASSYILMPPVGNFSQGKKNYTVPSRVGHHHVDALPDTGAQSNFISPQLAERVGVVLHEGTETMIELPGRKLLISPGTAKVPFSFEGESKRHMLDCVVLPGCTSDLVLSGAFLNATSTLSKFMSRIKESMRNMDRVFRVSLLGNEKNRLWGSLNGQPVLALPDTGSDVMLVSAEWAEKNKLVIDRGLEHKLKLELTDGSTTFTAGVVRNARWALGNSEQVVSCDFYVLDGLSVDVVLSNDFIFELGLFSRFNHLMANIDSFPDLSEFYNIRLIGKYSPELSRLEEAYLDDLNSSNAFSPEAVKAERVRRDQIRDVIDTLPLSRQEQARRDENNRQEIWDRCRSQHQRKQRSDVSENGQTLPTQRSRWWELRSLRTRIVGSK